MSKLFFYLSAALRLRLPNRILKVAFLLCLDLCMHTKALPIADPAVVPVAIGSSLPIMMPDDSQLLSGSNATRVQVQLVRFENPKSLMFDGRYCDFVSKCDPRIAVDLDIESPHATWPGPRHPETYQVLYEVSNKDVFNIAQAVSKDFCPGKKSLSTANLRVQILDIDDIISSPDLINQFECLFEFKKLIEHAKEEHAEVTPWSRIKECSAAFLDPSSIKLYYRYRMYDIPLHQQMTC